MKIRQDQVNVYRDQAVADFERRALQHVRTHFADQSKHETDSEVIERVRDCRRRVVAYRFTTQKQIMCFLDAGYLLRSNSFDDGKRYPELRQLLTDETLDPTEKAGMLVGWAMAIRKAAEGK